MAYRYQWFIPEKLAGGALPGRSCALEEDLADIARSRFSMLVSLYDPSKEREALFERLDLSAQSIAHISFAVPDYSAPQESCRPLLDVIHAEIIGGGRVLIHCGAGIGRTGMMMACYLVHTIGFQPKDAITLTRKRYKENAIETAGQVEYISRIAAEAAADLEVKPCIDE